MVVGDLIQAIQQPLDLQLKPFVRELFQKPAHGVPLERYGSGASHQSGAREKLFVGGICGGELSRIGVEDEERKNPSA